MEECTDAKIVFIKEKRSKNWLAILSTDISLPDEEIIRIYGKRWDIEVFFKVCKSNLALAREFQGRSCDTLTAATAIVFMRYAMLSIEARNKSDDRTIGELFYKLLSGTRGHNVLSGIAASPYKTYWDAKRDKTF